MAALVMDAFLLCRLPYQIVSVCTGVAMVCPPLAAVALGASLMNACMTGYAIYQLHGISNQLGKMDGKLDVVMVCPLWILQHA